MLGVESCMIGLSNTTCMFCSGLLLKAKAVLVCFFPPISREFCTIPFPTP